MGLPDRLAAQLQPAWRVFHIGVQIQQGQIDHTPALFVIDQRGRERMVYLTQMSYDEGTTEPSPGAIAAYLRGLRDHS